MTTWAEPGFSGISRSKYDLEVLELVDHPKQWAQIQVASKGSQISKFKRRYGSAFQFVSRRNEDGTSSLYGRYLGRKGGITLEDIRIRNLPFSERWVRSPDRKTMLRAA